MRGMKLPIALVQLDATDDVEANIARAIAMADDAAAAGARLVALPEYLQFRGSHDGYRASARPIPGPHTAPFAEVARRRDAWILMGSTAEVSGDPARPYNTSTLIAPDGSIAATYRKIHLFDAAVEGRPVDTESDFVSAGDLAGRDVRRRHPVRPVDLLRPAFPRAVPGTGTGRSAGPDRARQLHGTDRSGPLGGPAPRPGDRERRVRHRAGADRRTGSVPGLRALDGHRPVGHGRRPGTG